MRARRNIAFALAVVLQVQALAAFAQERGKVWRVGFLSPRRHLAPPESDYYDEIPRGLTQLGYVEGKDFVIEWRFADGAYTRLPVLAAELAKIPVDVIVADGTPAVIAAQKATQTVPIVFPSAGDPVGNGLVKSLARPGGNTTGISLLAGESIVNKELEMLLAISPRLSRVAALLNPDNAYSRIVLEKLRAAAGPSNVQILSVEARSPRDVEAGFNRMTREQAGSFIWIADAVLFQQSCQIAALAVTNRLPGIGQGHSYPACGGLISYGSNQWDNYRRATLLVDKIFKGANPGDLPVEQPTKLELVINRKTAKTLGLTIPPDLLVLADRVIE